MEEVYAGTVYMVDRSDRNDAKLKRFAGQCEFEISDLSLQNAPGNMATDFANAVSGSTYAKALCQFFQDNSYKFYIIFGSQAWIDTSPMTVESGSKKTRGMYYNVGRSYYISNRPSSTGGRVPNAVPFPPAIIMLHEMGHVWQEIKASAWYNKQVEFANETIAPPAGSTMTRRKAAGQAMLSLDLNNLDNWEWPICKQLGWIKRDNYYLLQRKVGDAKAARLKSLTLGGSEETKFMTKKFEGGTAPKYTDIPAAFKYPIGWKTGQPANGLTRP